MYQTHHESSEALCRYVSEQSGGVCLLSFSCGKDSIAAWLHLRRFFPTIHPVYMYLVPGLEFVDRSLAYYEKAFKTRILRMPHPSLYRWLTSATFQAPENLRTIEEARLPDFDYDDVFAIAKEAFSIPDETFTAIGVRATDSLNRWASIKKYGSLNNKRHTFFPIYDFSKDRLIETIRESGVKLPIDYTWFGRSFDGLDYRFLKPLRDHSPRDYARILEFFPLAEVELHRQPYREAYYERHHA